MERKPRLFIGCSTESLSIADAINENLDHSCEVTIWRNGTFKLANNTIDSLIEKASSVDFAAFIFSQDDIATIRNIEEKVVRDNVIFELGLFIGTIGKQRSFIVKPRNVDLHFPTDLLGVTTADYEPKRSDGDITSALNFACSLMKREIETLGLIKTVNTYKASSPNFHITNINLSEIDFKFLAVLIATATDSPTGLNLWYIKETLKIRDPRIDISSIKLEKLGLIQKENDIDGRGEDFYAYKISQDGLSILLKEEQRLYKLYEVEEDDLPF
ncbi:TIR domain-containing protein [Pontibacter silvestris]|uniref:TIR domain-containing protein n=1 Tax=Pontibacter silvestris TaxID=2305183 RepID=A0ABW4X332_9BACT|nr:nucleotide-binding protein [Pontibacter silvestris]MCC9135694.1 nucleotide-binding protein [Pontibacter silvestris]